MFLNLIGTNVYSYVFSFITFYLFFIQVCQCIASELKQTESKDLSAISRDEAHVWI
jgi:hypothetical protein